MSGTSLDGVDGVVLRLDAGGLPQVLCHAARPLEASLQDELFALHQPTLDELRRSAVAANRIALLYAQVVEDLIGLAFHQRVGRTTIKAIGAHGQTIRHQPDGDEFERHTLQLLNPALLAERTGLSVVADFRSRDMAAGGQGAPLVPAFHQAVFASDREQTCVLNLGGIANLTVLRSARQDKLLGFDCGPGNMLLDAWCRQNTGQAFDQDGHWAASGQVSTGLLECFLTEPYFERNPPKSTGRDLFDTNWLMARINAHASLSAADVQATLSELTVQACANAVRRWSSGCTRLIVCGGGALNTDLMQRLARALRGVTIMPSDGLGLPAQQVEAAAFAWLARQTMNHEPSNVPSVTGAAGARVLGAIYPA